MKNQKLLNLLSSGNNIKADTIANTLGIEGGSVAKRVLELRRNGYSVHKNTVKESGQKFTAYRLGTPTKQVIAAGYAALALAKTNSSVRTALAAQNII